MSAVKFFDSAVKGFASGLKCYNSAVKSLTAGKKPKMSEKNDLALKEYDFGYLVNLYTSTGNYSSINI